MSLWNKIITQNKIDSALISDLNDISYKSTKGRREKGRSFRDNIVDIGTLPFKENPPPDKITKEMIQEYHQSMTGPIKDPITGAILVNKYHPSTIQLDIADLNAPPTLINFNGLGKPADETVVQALKDNIKKYIEIDLPNLKADFKKVKDNMRDLKDLINKGIATKDPTTGDITYTALSSADKKKAEADFKNEERRMRAINRDITQIQFDLIPNEKKLIQSALNNIKDNIQITITHNNQIKQNLQRYRESLISQNKSRIGTVEEQLPNETQEQYLQRMKDLEAEAYDIDLYYEKSALEQIIILKQNLRTLFNKDSLIENIIKSFAPKEIFIINKHFPSIYEYFLENYGRNNINLDLKDIVEVITRILEKILNPVVEYEVEEEVAPPPALPTITASSSEPVPLQNFQIEVEDPSNPGSKILLPTDIDFGTDNNSLFIQNNKDDNHVFFKTGINDKGNTILLYSTDENTGGHFKEVKEREISGKNNSDVLKNILKTLKLSKLQKDNILTKNITVKNLIERLEKPVANGGYDVKPLDKTKIKTKYFIDASGKKYSRFGAGLKDPEQDIPTYAEFGNMMIMLHKLYYKNILALKLKSGRAIDGLTNAKVSNNFVNIIMDMYAGKDVSGQIKNLKTDEKHLLNSIIYQAGLHKKFNVNTNESLTGLKEKHKIIEGEILAGNNNPELVKELKNVLLKIHHLGAISIPAIQKYLKQFQ